MTIKINFQQPEDRDSIPSVIVQRAQDLYSTLVGLTSSPAEAQQMILIMHILLWINARSGATSVDVMLKEYTDNFIANLRANGDVEGISQ